MDEKLSARIDHTKEVLGAQIENLRLETRNARERLGQRVEQFEQKRAA